MSLLALALTLAVRIALVTSCTTPNMCVADAVMCPMSRRVNDTCTTAGDVCCAPAPTPKPTTPAPTPPPTPSRTPMPTPMPTPRNCAPGSTEVAGACSDASVCGGLNGTFIGDSACGMLGCCTIGACVWSEWSVCDCVDVIETKRTRSRREIALPPNWPVIPNCPPMTESSVCRQCLQSANDSTTANATLAPSFVYINNDYWIAPTIVAAILALVVIGLVAALTIVTRNLLRKISDLETTATVANPTPPTSKTSNQYLNYAGGISGRQAESSYDALSTRELAYHV